jgi:hypothetical protein
LKNRIKLPEVSSNAKTLWLYAALLGAIVGVGNAINYLQPHFRDATAAEKSQLDKILRPAAVSVARSAVGFYLRHPGSGTINTFGSELAHPEKSVELYVQAHTREGKLTIIADLQRHNGVLEPDSTYDLAVYGDQDPNKDALIITSINLAENTLAPKFLLAQTPDGSVEVDLFTQTTDSDFRQSLKDAKKIAKIAETDSQIIDQS